MRAADFHRSGYSREFIHSDKLNCTGKLTPGGRQWQDEKN